MTSDTRVLRLDIPGEWSDGWLYKNHLILWTRTGQMHVTSLDNILKSIRRQTSPSISVVAQYLLFRNDWKASDQFHQILQVPEVEHNFVAELDPEGESTVIALENLDGGIAATESIPGAGLDTAIYANRVYSASTNGLFETRFDPQSPLRRNPVISRLNHRVVSVSAAYSAVNSSANEEGLWFSQVDFGDASWWKRDRAFKRVAEFSRGNSFAYINLLNYTDEAFPDLMRSAATRERPHDRAEYDEWRITGYGQATKISGLAASTLRTPGKVQLAKVARNGPADEAETAQVLGNSNYRLLVAWQGGVRVVNIAAHPGKDIEARSDSAFRGIANLRIEPSSVLETYPFGGGFIVEMFDSLCLLNQSGSFMLLGAPVARVRTFAQSRRHREVVLAVREDGISLLGIFQLRHQGPGF